MPIGGLRECYRRRAEMTEKISQADLAELGKLVEAQPKVKCPYCAHGGYPECRQLGNCSECHGTGRVPDPAYDGLRKVLSEKCWRCEEDRAHEQPANAFCACGGTGYVPRNWEGQPDGAYRGALLVAAEKARLLWLGRTGMHSECEFLYHMTDEQATQCIVEALKVKEKARGKP